MAAGPFLLVQLAPAPHRTSSARVVTAASRSRWRATRCPAPCRQAAARLRTLGDLGAAKLPVRLAAGDECVQRPYCAPGLRKTYGIDVVAVDPKGVGTTQAEQAVRNGQDQMVLTTTTDGTLDRFGLVLLEDDKNLQNADHVVPVVNRARAGSTGVRDALGRLNTVLTTADLAAMNERVDSWRRLPEDVARTYLESKKLLPEG